MEPKSGLIDPGMQLLTKVLDLRAQNQQIIAANIANAETPGYSPAKFTFEDELRSVLSSQSGLQLTSSHQKHIPLGPRDIQSVQGTITINPDQTGIGDENGVSVDEEMLALSENELLYETAAQLLKKKMGILKYVVSGGQ
ncbi:flagellar basal body rod protein FlgB [Desulfosediminicola flagellatus]|uniref:flagellar basal body rod protein FlgB n=1 Tax=Desulfosediminicola flagellatus TaxID=2569541 RepID=UPI0010AC444C|nr:flagellar basal body rod protein FlgB [Desulfosediminicola flagellatus]